ncbi:DegT/DnrJ/EryC1/StrS family aminotransferase [Thiohalophilus thiocyanatoxydans]|uniref:dTDP-4-amino-4,6-dideoxygalactose transaminase n=1 Tax=Thiohalophilus thiocyanatoxydans TaxID=381308 RepID=A0A4R8IRD6_9GAMM|nr:DegT/DnrJ/EryC1/StrS family aminotransferase [Thiohalophilus thiocyanatoxydans]TDY00127.1 dTDP-4-amino-4,6-dideoxygalactose transaminase [Thiohalophilus thiocyanatoxydans]
MIPMVDLKEQYQTLKAEIEQGFAETFENTSFILGPNVKSFESEVADYLGVKHAISCASGTDALHLALVAAGIGRGDEVITSSFTFIATAEAIRYVGAIPVYVDIHPDTYNLDAGLIEAAMTDKTRAILPVHLFGQPTDMASIMALADKHNLKVIEDCAQSFGADINGKMTGSIGLAGAHSFFPSKNLGCYGDGGMITTNDDAVAEMLLMLRNHGSKERYYHEVVGYNSRLDELQAVILRAKFKRLPQYNQQRRRVAHRYSAGLAGSVVTPPHEDGLGTHVYHQYTVLSDQRDAVMKKLADNQIGSAIYYPVPLHQQKVFADVCKDVSLPVTEEIAGRCLSLPVYPELKDAQIDQIVDVIQSI